MEEAEVAPTPAYCLGRSPEEGDLSKRARVHCHTQAWASGQVPRSLRDTIAGQPRKISCS
jgi:glycogen debranching enzyme